MTLSKFEDATLQYASASDDALILATVCRSGAARRPFLEKILALTNCCLDYIRPRAHVSIATLRNSFR